jgi:mono/diheme cytochrome c family protein
MPKPADPLSDTMYDMTSLNRLFFLSCVILTFVTIWMAWQDYDRNWKRYQRDFNELALAQAQKDLEAKNREVDHKDLEEKKAALDKATADLETVKENQDKLEKLRDEREDNRGPMEEARLKWMFLKSEEDTLKQRTEHAGDQLTVAREHAKAGGEDAKTWEGKIPGLEGHYKDADAAYQDKKKVTQEAKLVFEDLTKKDVEKAAEIATMLKAQEDAQKAYDKARSDIAFIERRISKLEPSLATTLLNLPGLDFVAPTIKIEQDILMHFQEDLNFSSVFKIDRCRTCHLAIDKKGWTDPALPAVFRSHPNLDLYVGDNSPHPVGQYGCTTCHGGQGRSVDFYHAAHMPKDKKQGQRWEEEYSWHPIGHFDQPMLPMPYIEASCTKCHSAQHRVTMGEKVNEGKRLLEKVGCYGCHPIAGTEDLRKPGPGLRGIKHKVTKDWAFNWIRKPTSFRPTTHMPQAFDLSNTSDEEAKKKNAAMIASIVEFLFDESQLGHVAASYPAPPAGDAARGERVFNQVGCLACHEVKHGEKGTVYTNFGPNLAGVGSKLNPGWIYAWVKDPQQYFPYASMPNLRLTDQEAADVTAWLMTLKHPDGYEYLKAADVSDDDLAAALLDFKMAQLPEKEARALVHGMDRKSRLSELGKQAVSHMGCFGCHDVNGFEKTKQIGAGLTGANATGSKDITKFDFGFRHDLMERPHHPGAYDRTGWVLAKLEDPRTFDIGRIVGYADRLRMPQFNLTKEEREALATYVLSFRTRENIPVSHTRNLTHEEAMINAGKRLADQSNCASCHKMGNLPSRVLVRNDEELIGNLAKARLYAARNILTDGRQVDRISAGELAILEKKGIRIMIPKGKWLYGPQYAQIAEKWPEGIRILVYAQDEGAIKDKVAEGMAPPYIVGEGAKVNPEWLFHFLKKPVEIRPWLKQGGVRMPTFGFTDQEATTLVTHFAHLSGEQFPYISEPEIEESERNEMISRGRAVFDKNQCGKCHVVAGVELVSNTPAPEFAKVGPRIQRDWFAPWVRDPQSIFPGTGMTQFNPSDLSDEELRDLQEYIWSLHKK